MPQRFDQKRKGRRRLAAAWIVEMIAGKGRAPILKHPHETAFARCGCARSSGR